MVCIKAAALTKVMRVLPARPSVAHGVRNWQASLDINAHDDWLDAQFQPGTKNHTLFGGGPMMPSSLSKNVVAREVKNVLEGIYYCHKPVPRRGRSKTGNPIIQSKGRMAPFGCHAEDVMGV